MHHHPQEQWGVCLEASATRFQDDEAIPLARGDSRRRPGGVSSTIEPGPDGCTVPDGLAMPREA